MRTTRTSEGRGSDDQRRNDQQRDEHENFARAVDSGLRDVADLTMNHELTVVAALRHAGARIGPDPAERDRMRQRVMAEFSSVVHDGSSPVLPLQSSRNRPSRNAAPARRWIPGEARGRLLVAAAATLCLVMSLSGMSVLLSRDALPGDALYSFKRTAESAELGLTFGDQPKALKHLEFASARVGEIEMMAADAADNRSAGRDGFRRALDDFDADTTAGARLLTTLATHGQANILFGLRGWAQQQETRLSAVRAALPLPAGTRLDSTLGLLDRVVARTSALDNRADCTTITSGTRDDLGLRPARDVCKPAPLDGIASTVPLPDVVGAPAGISPNIIVPPGLLDPPSVNPVPVPDQSNPKARPGLPKTSGPGGVLPAPSETEDKPSRRLPGQDGSRPPILPLPFPGIPLPLLPPPA